MNYELRDYQKYAVDKIVDAILNNKSVFLNAPTGSGKTLIVLESLKRLKDSGFTIRVLYFVRTINEYVPILRDVKKFGFNFNVVGMIGKQRLCDYELKWLMDELEGEINICKICPKFGMVSTEISFDDIIEQQSIHLALDKISEKYCKYFTLLKLASVSDILMVTLPYMLGKPRYIIDRIFSPTLIVVDEAHNLDNINQYVSVTLKLHDIEILVRNGFDVKSMLEFHQKRFSNDKEIVFVEKSDLQQFVGSVDPEVWSKYEEVIDGKLDGKVDLAKAIIRFVRFWEYINDPAVDLFLTKRSFKLLVTDVSELLKRGVTHQFIMMSGTLPPHDYIRDVWELDGEYIDLEKEFGIFKHNRIWVWYDRVSMKYELRRDMINKYRKLLDRLLPQIPKVALVVFPSYDVMKQFMSVIVKYGGIVEDERTRIEDIVDQVKKGAKIIYCVASGKITEGVELVENDKSLIKSIVLVGVPYPVPDDFNKRKAERIVKKLVEKGGLKLEGKKFRDMIFRYTVHIPALILSKQAIGRGIRFPQDRNMILLLDGRFKFFFDELGVGNVLRIRD